MKVQSSENKLVINEEFIFDQNKLSKDPNNHFKQMCKMSKTEIMLISNVFNDNKFELMMDDTILKLLKPINI